MVELLETTVIEKGNLNQIKASNPRFYEQITQSEKSYACDCDSFGGGDPPCDCNR